ncbi:hypothetical protein K449DRAFT_438716 [Hypoxylon sp. EC38]|nr:hypothetical protein K449DRAFT_438716 [Hypoxylon sp. EC38]
MSQGGSSSHSGNVPPGISESYDDGDRFTNSPPPGLVRVTEPVATSDQEYKKEQEVQTRVISDMSLFSDIVEYFDTGVDLDGNHIVLNLECTLCHENRLEVPPAVSPRVHPEEATSLEPMVVLPCGHFFGAWCLRQWVRPDPTGELFLDNCPLCRFPVKYPECGHNILIQPYYANTPRHHQLPLTIPEEGVIPNFCAACRIRWVQFVAKQVAETLYPQDIPQSAYYNKERSGPRDYSHRRNLLRTGFLNIFMRTEREFSHW